MALIDVREDIATGREPLARIMAAVQALASDEDLELVVSFEPAPLYEAMAQRGFTRESEQGADEVARDLLAAHVALGHAIHGKHPGNPRATPCGSTPTYAEPVEA